MRFNVNIATDGEKAKRIYAILDRVIYELGLAFKHSVGIRQYNQANLSQELIKSESDNDIFINIGQYYHLNDIGANYSFRPYFNLPKTMISSLLKNNIMPNGCIAMPLVNGEEAFEYLSSLLKQYGFKSYLDDNNLTARLCYSPDKLGNVVFDYQNGLFIKSLIDNMYSLNGMWFEYCMSGNSQKLYIVMPSDRSNIDDVSPYGALYALAYALNDNKLYNESECLYNITNNVSVELWRTGDIYFDGARAATNTEICDIIIEQISVVGRVML